VAPETGKARLPTVERLNGGTESWSLSLIARIDADSPDATGKMYRYSLHNRSKSIIVHRLQY